MSRLGCLAWPFMALVYVAGAWSYLLTRLRIDSTFNRTEE